MDKQTNKTFQTKLIKCNKLNGKENNKRKIKKTTTTKNDNET